MSGVPYFWRKSRPVVCRWVLAGGMARSCVGEPQKEAGYVRGGTCRDHGSDVVIANDCGSVSSCESNRRYGTAWSTVHRSVIHKRAGEVTMPNRAERRQSSKRSASGECRRSTTRPEAVPDPACSTSTRCRRSPAVFRRAWMTAACGSPALAPRSMRKWSRCSRPTRTIRIPRRSRHRIRCVSGSVSAAGR